MPNMLAGVLKQHTLDMGSLGSMCGGGEGLCLSHPHQGQATPSPWLGCGSGPHEALASVPLSVQ